jgi:hypothetical protein
VPAAKRVMAKILKKKNFSDDWQVFTPPCKENCTKSPGFHDRADFL